MSRLVSIVVISHNYEQFLGQAIDSALAQSHKALQVLVVDDGSTDSSPAIIRGYGDRVEPLLKPNGGNSSAVNTAFPHCRGEIVMFLDADDFLYPNAVSRVLSAWNGSCAKVEFRLSLIDGNSVRRGVEPPASAPMPHGDVIPEIAAWGRYVTPVLTGNAFRRTALERILPIPAEPLFENHNDGYLNPLCAFCGPIASVDEELGVYRLHGGNQWAYTSGVHIANVRMRIRHELVRERYMREAALRQGRELPSSLMLRNSSHIVYRLASLKLDPASHPEPDDSLRRLLLILPGALRRNPELDTLERAFTLFNGVLIVVLPRRLASTPVDWALASRPYPGWVRAGARLARSVTRLGAQIKLRCRGLASAKKPSHTS
jgi:glycosyltransferase involved in cell wall biosynthesis